jgi:hypothetical protein
VQSALVFLGGNRVLKKRRTYLGRVIRRIGRKIEGNGAQPQRRKLLT